MAETSGTATDDLAQARNADEHSDTFVLTARLVKDYVKGAVESDDYFDAVDVLSKVAVRQALADAAARRR